MTELLTSEQMRALEKRAMSSGEVSGLTLMERAGQGVVDAIFAKWPAFGGKKLRALVLCGPGNNGGDGFVIARLLAARGWQVSLFLFGQAEKLPPDARVNHDRWVDTGAAVRAWLWLRDLRARGVGDRDSPLEAVAASVSDRRQRRFPALSKRHPTTHGGCHHRGLRAADPNHRQRTPTRRGRAGDDGVSAADEVG